VEERSRLCATNGLLTQDDGFPVHSFTVWRTPAEDRTCQTWTCIEEIPFGQDS
jgi:hypothetical protein